MGSLISTLDKRTKNNLVTLSANFNNRGIVYISKIPIQMKPQKIRTLLNIFGTTDRIFIAPKTFRTSLENNIKETKKQMFTEAWVEFLQMKDAKTAALLLNGQPIGR